MVKAIIKYRNHPSIIAFRNSVSHSLKKSDTLKEIKNLQINQATQDTDIPTKFIKNNSFSFFYFDFIFTNLNDSIV